MGQIDIFTDRQYAVAAPNPSLRFDNASWLICARMQESD